MKNKIITLIILLALAIASTHLTSCKKYEEGPSVSFLTKKSRLVNQWDYCFYINSEGEEIAGNNIMLEEFTLRKDGSGNAYMCFGSSMPADQEIKWDLSKDKTELQFSVKYYDSYSGQWLWTEMGNTENYEITMLKKDELHIKGFHDMLWVYKTKN